MIESPLLLTALGVIGACLVATTVASLLTMRELSLALRRLNAALPRAEGALRELQQLLARWNAMTRRVEAVVGSACDAASATLEGLGRWKARAEHLVAGRFGNGAGAEPRRHGRATRGGNRG